MNEWIYFSVWLTNKILVQYPIWSSSIRTFMLLRKIWWQNGFMDLSINDIYKWINNWNNRKKIIKKHVNYIMILYHSYAESIIMKLLEKIREYLKIPQTYQSKDFLSLIININYKLKFCINLSWKVISIHYQIIAKNLMTTNKWFIFLPLWMESTWRILLCVIWCSFA